MSLCLSRLEPHIPIHLHCPNPPRLMVPNTNLTFRAQSVFDYRETHGDQPFFAFFYDGQTFSTWVDWDTWRGLGYPGWVGTKTKNVPSDLRDTLACVPFHPSHPDSPLMTERKSKYQFRKKLPNIPQPPQRGFPLSGHNF